MSLTVLAFLTVLDRDGGAPRWPAVDAALLDLCDLYDKSYSRAWDAASRYAGLSTPDPLAGLFTLLAAFGAVTGVTDEEELRVPEAFQAGAKKIVYTYDFGTGWRHEITLEERRERQPGQPYPVCSAFSGDSPVEYWDEDDPSDPEPFSLSEVNQRLTADGKRGAR